MHDTQEMKSFLQRGFLGINNRKTVSGSKLIVHGDNYILLGGGTEAKRQTDRQEIWKRKQKDHHKSNNSNLLLSIFI